MEIDVWFAKNGDDVYVVTCPPGEVPQRRARKVKGVSHILKIIKSKGYTIIQVGITDPNLMELR